MKYLGIAFAVASLFAFVRLYVADLKKRSLCYTEISRLAEHIGERLKTERAPLKTLCRGFECAELRACGFFEYAIERGDVKGGVDRLTVDGSDKSAISEFLCEFGSGYLDTELKRAARLSEHLAKRSAEEREGCASRIRVARLLFGSFVLALCLLCV